MNSFGAMFTSRNLSQRHFGFVLSGLAIALIATLLAKPWLTRGQSTNNQIDVRSAASYSDPPVLTPESIAAAFGSRLATRTEIARGDQPLPTNLAGTSVTVNGVPALLFYASPTQVNFVIPGATAAGTANIVVTASDGAVSTGTVQVSNIAPAIFTADASGRGLPAAYLLRVFANNTRRNEPIAQFNPATNRYEPIPIVLGPEGERVFLILYLCGVRRAAQGTVRIMLNGVEKPPSYVGVAPDLTGLDQINVELLRSLNGRVSVQVESGSISSNIVEVEVAAPGKSATTLTASSSANPALFGQPVTFTAEVRGAGGTPTGMVIFRAGAATLGSSNLSAGKATISVSSLAPGEHPITAHYNGDNAFKGSWVEMSEKQRVKALTNVTVTSSKETAVRGETIKFTAMVTANPSGARTPTGTVQFKDNDIPLLTPIELINGSAELIVSTLAPEPQQHVITVEYLGDPNFQGNTSAPRPQRITNPGTLQASRLDPSTPVYAGDEVTIYGSGFSNDPNEHAVTVTASDDGIPKTAEVTKAAYDQLRVRVGFGSGSGNISVTLKNSSIPASNSRPITLRTSISGHVQEAVGGVVPKGVAGVTLSVRGVVGVLPAVTNDSGFFQLRLPSETGFPSSVELVVDGTTVPGVPGGPKYDKVIRKEPLRPSRDNQFSDFEEKADIIEIKRINQPPMSAIASNTQASQSLNASTVTGAQQCTDPIPSASGRVTFCRNNSTCSRGVRCPLSLTELDPGRTPSNLPVGYFSSTIVQITPFGETLTLGGKLIFPNSDGIPLGAQVKLFRFEQNANDPMLGRFREIEAFNLSGDGTKIETSDNAVKQTSYYFVSRLWPTTVTIRGKVIETDGFPVRRAVVNARGQSAFTNDFGTFELESLPVITPDGLNDRVTIEISYVRPDQRVDRTQRSVPISANATTIVDEAFVLPRQTPNRQPLILAPSSLVVTEGEMRNFNFGASDPDGQTPNVMVSGAPFASMLNPSCNTCTLRLAPGSNSAGDYKLKITATDPEGLVSTQDVVVIVQRANNSALVANDLSVTIDEGQSVQLPLSVSNAGGRPLSYVFTSPQYGTIGGANPNKIYRPLEENFNGLDSFSFMVRDGARESNWATVVIAVNPVNDPPTLTVSKAEPLTVNAGETVKIDLSVTDVDVGQTYSFTADGLPPGAAFIPSAKTAQFIWTPTFTQKGSYEVSFMVSDDGYPTQPKDNKKVTITVDAKWAKTSGPDGGSIRSMLNSGDVLYAGAAGSGVYRSTDKGRSWAFTGPLPGGDALALAVVSGTSLYAGTDKGVYRFDVQGWTAVNTGLSDAGLKIRAFAVSGGILYAGTDGGGVYRLNGQMWVSTTGGGLSGRGMNVWALADSGGTLYAGTDGGGVYRFNGQMWVSTGGGLSGPGLNIRALAVSGGFLYAGTDADGVYRFNGQIWEVRRVGLSDGGLKIRALADIGGTLYAGTDGGGVYRLSGQSWVSVKDGLSRGGYKVRALAIIATTLYAGTEGEGVYRLSDNGQSWINSSAGIAASQISTLLRFGNNLYAGTLFRGVYRSADDGQSWEPVNAGLLDEGLNVRALAAVMGTKLYVGTEGDGVYVLSDDGKSWSRVGMGLTGNGLRVWTLAVSGTSLFAGAANPFPGPENPVDGRAGVYRLSDDGKIWERRSTGLTGAGMNVWALGFNGNDLYAGSAGGGVYRSRNGGMNWEQVRNGLPNDGQVCAFTFSVTGLYVGDLGRGVYRSTNNGQTWEQLIDGLSARGASTIWAQTFYGTSVYAGTSDGVYRFSDSDMKWKPIGSRLPNTIVLTLTFNGAKLFAGTLGDGVSLLSDSAQSWAPNTDGLLNTFVNSVAVSSSYIFAGTLGSGVFRSPIQDNLSWSRPDNSLPLNADIRSIATDGSNVWAAADRDGIYHSSNQGGSWTKVPVPDNRAVNELFFNSPMLYAGTNSGVLFSMNQGASWMDAGLPNRRVISFAASGGVLYAGTDGGGIFRYNGGTTWTPVQGLPASLSVRALVVSGTTFYAGTIGDGIFISNNGGETWAKAMNGLPQKMNVYAFEAIERDGKKKVYAGTIYGVYVTEDAGQNWKLENAGLLNVFVTGLKASEDRSRLFASTASGGVFVSQIP